jgi:hypothetical protein
MPVEKFLFPTTNYKPSTIPFCYTESVEQTFQKRTWMNVGLIVATFAVFGIVFYFLAQKIDALGGEIIMARGQAAERTYALENLSMLRAAAPQAANYKKQLDALIPKQDDIFGFQAFLQSMARVHQVDVSFSYDGAPVLSVGTQPGYFPFSANVTGAVQNSREFLDELESKTTKFLVNIDTVDVTADQSSYHTDIKGKVYFH